MVQHLVARYFGYYQSTIQLGVSPASGSASFTKPIFLAFRTKSYCLIEYLCTPYPTIYGVGKLTAIEHVDQMQNKAHAQGQGKHAQASAGHARTKGPHKHNTRARRHGLSAKTNRLTNAQRRARYTQAGAHKRDMRHKQSTRTQEGHAAQAPGQLHRTCRRPLS